INWTGAPGGTPDNHFYNNDKVVFSNTGTTSPTLSGNVTTGAISVTTGSGHDYAIGGSGNVTVLGSVVHSCSVNASFASNGNLVIGGNVTVSGTGTLELANSGTLAVGGSISINNGTLALNRSADIAVANTVSGSGTFRKANT